MKILDVPQSGSAAGTTSSRNRFGQYRRTRAVPVNPGSPAQSSARSSLAAASQAWAGLTEAQRAAWAAYAEGHPRTDSLGQTIILTGHQMFVGFYAAAAAAALSLPTDAPYGEPPAAPAMVVTALNDSAVSVTLTPGVVPANSSVVIEAGRPVSPGVTFFKDYRVVRVFAAAADVSPADISAAYVAKFGSPTTGTKVFIRAKIVGPNGPSEYAYVSGVSA